MANAAAAAAAGDASALAAAPMAELSSAALAAFTSADHERAATCLADLAALSLTVAAPDPRVAYNTAVLHFYSRGGVGGAGPLLAATVDLLPEAVRAAVPREPMSRTLATLAAPDVLAAVRAAVGFVPIFNAAVVAYNGGRIWAADKLVTFLFSHVEAMEEDWLALRTCLLAMDIHLRTGALAAAGRVMTYVEDLFHAADPALPFAKVTPPWPGAAVSIMTLPTCRAEVTCCMHLYAARLGAAQSDAKLLKKEAKSAVVLSADDGPTPTAAALLVKAKLDLNASKVLRVMESVHAQAPPRVRAAAWPLLLNNLGVIHHRLGRHALAALYLERSRAAFSSLFGAERRSTSVLVRARETHVAYNLGLENLQLGHHRAALTLFSDCARADEVLASRSPMLWIRIAECCVGEAGGTQSNAPVAQVRGRGLCRRHVLCAPPGADATLMQYAAMCSRAALAIMDRSPVAFATTVADEVTADAANRQRCAALALIAFTTLHFDPAAAIVACDELVSCSRPGDSDHAVLGRLYGAEALCSLGRPDEAVDRLAPLLAMSGASFADGREGAFVNAALAHTLRGDMAAAVRAAKAALKVTAASATNCSPRRDAIAVAAYVNLRDDNVEAARHILSATR
jgi:hypothetical protein